jgi:hypothetical protein
MRTSESVKNISVALINAQTEIKEIAKNCNVSFISKKTGFKTEYSYTSYDDIMKTIKPILLKNKITILQPLTTLQNNESGVCTRLQHESGEYFESDVSFSAAGMSGVNTMQDIGAGISYIRRYALSAILALVTDEDNDANSFDDDNKKQIDKPSKQSDTVKQPNSIGIIQELKKSALDEKDKIDLERRYYTTPEGARGAFAEFIRSKIKGVK